MSPKSQMHNIERVSIQQGTVQMHKPWEQNPSQSLIHGSSDVHCPLNVGLRLQQVFPSVSVTIHPVTEQHSTVFNFYQSNLFSISVTNTNNQEDRIGSFTRSKGEEDERYNCKFSPSFSRHDFLLSCTLTLTTILGCHHPILYALTYLFSF